MTLPFDCCIYVWRWSLRASMFDVAWLVVASMFDAIACCYRPRHRTTRYGKQWCCCRSCCCCRHCATLNMKQLMRCWARSRHMVLLQPFSCCPRCRHATRRWKWCALAHEALSWSSLCGATYRLVWATDLWLTATGTIAGSYSFLDPFFSFQKYHVPIPM